ncbi:MAG: caspase family protein [Burkholderiales bacterium]|nr:caspase family protein [Burkholderiales bacterium]
MRFWLFYLLLFIILWVIVISGCQSTISSEGLANKRDSLAKLIAGDCHGLYSTSNSADTVIRLSSSEENTIFSIDGKEVGQAKFLKACIEKGKKYEIVAAPPECVPKKELTQPPYSSPIYDFRFMLSDCGGSKIANNFNAENDTPPKKTSEVPGNNPKSASIASSKYIALLIGNNQYRHIGSLQTAVNDAMVLKSILEKKYGFKAELLMNATRSEILGAISNLQRAATTDTSVLIYYAGHGYLAEDENRGYWMPVDADMNNPANWVANDDITSKIRAMAAKHVLVVADSCYSGMMTREIPSDSFDWKRSNQEKWTYWEKMSKKKARKVMSSGGLEPVLDKGGDGNHSVFASAIINVLKENEGILEGTELFTQVRQKVKWNAHQTPEYAPIHQSGHDGGDFFFIPRK